MTLFDSLSLGERILPEISSFGDFLFRKICLVSIFLNWSVPSVIIIKIPAEANATFIILSHRKLLAHGMSPPHFCTTARIVRTEAPISSANIPVALIQLWDILRYRLGLTCLMTLQQVNPTILKIQIRVINSITIRIIVTVVGFIHEYTSLLIKNTSKHDLASPEKAQMVEKRLKSVASLELSVCTLTWNTQ